MLLPIILIVFNTSGYRVWGQINYSFDFNANSTGWTGNFTRFTGSTACGGTGGAMRRNLYGSATTGQLISPLTGTSNGANATVSYTYKAAVWSANTAAASNWGNFQVQYGATANGPWTTFATVTNETQLGNACISKSHTVTLPAGATYIRFNATYQSGDYYLNFDNVGIVQTALTACSGTPSAGSASISSSSGCSGLTQTLSATALTTGTGISYQWQSASAAVGPWTNIPGATSATSSVSPSTTTYYRLVTTCSNGGATNNTNVISYTVTGSSCAGVCPISIPALPVSNQSVVCTGTNLLNSGNVPACGAASTLYLGGNEALYTIVPTVSGNSTITYSGQTYSSIWVWSGACPNSGGTCVGSVSGSGSTQTLTISMTAGVTYYLLFDTWPSPASPCPGTFSITSPTAPPAAPTNDLVCSATSITCGASLSGTTVNATNSGTGEGGSCGTSQTMPGVWYVVAGNGQTMTASLCATAWDSKMSVYSGSNCSSLTCVGGIDDGGPACTGASASYSWPTVSGVNYYILVHGYSTNSAFSINLSCVTPPPPTVVNDLVCSATSITCGASLSGTTVNATNSGTGEGGSCGTAQTMPGVWYVVAGNGQTMTASLCATAWDSKLSVYSGPNCSSLTCVGGIDDGGPACAGASASYSWNSVSGTNYYILVHGYSTNSTFSINLTCVAPTPPPANDDCANAQSVTIQCPASATVVSGTTANATEEGIIADPSCDPGTIRDVWYTFNSGPNTSVSLTVTLGTANWLGGEVHTTCGNPAPGLTIGGNAGNCDFYLLNPAPTVISGLVPNTTYRLRLFTNTDFDVAGTFSFTLTNSMNNPGAVSIPASICAGTATSITNVTSATGGPNNVNYYFYYRGGPSNVGWQMYDGPTTNTSSSLPATVINTPGTWFIARNSDFGCGQANNATTLDLQLIVNAASTAPTLSGISPVCPSTSVTINASGGTASPGSTINWYTGPNGTGSFLGSGSSYTVTPMATSTFYARREGGCNNTTDGSFTITINTITTSTPLTSSDMIWRGSSNSDYSLVSNWLTYNGTSMVPATSLPTTLTNVIISSAQTCVLNQPSLGANTVNAKNITIENGATINMGSGTLNVGGDFTNNGTFIPGTSTVKMVGTATQDFIYGVGASHVFYNLTIDKQGGDEVVLNSHIDVTNELRVTNKNFRLNSLNIDLGTTGMIMDEGPGHRIYCDCPVGFVQRTITIPANTTVDPGNLGLSITTNANAMGSTVIKRRHLRAGSNGTTELVTGTPGVYRIFDVTPEFNGGSTYPLAAGGLDVDLEFQYYIDEVGPEILAQEGEFGIWRSGDTGSTWEPHYGTVNTTTKTISLEGWQQFSWVTGGPVESPSTLPIELVSFQANCTESSAIAVTWTTASEHNTSHYVVEKSRDGINWSVLGQTAAAGNSTELLNYELIDSEKANGTTYYRLTQFDNDGVYEVFDPVSVNCNSKTSNNHIMTYPNPSDASFYVSLFTETMNGSGQLNILDGSGRTVYSTSVNIQDGNNVFHIGDMNAAPGMYYIQVTQGNTTTDIVKHSLR